jgi:hypothetical protein
MRRLVLAALAAALPVLALPETASAVGSQHTLTDATVVHTATVPTKPAFNSPANWRSPDNYADGTAYLRLQVTAKASAKPTKAQFCMWRHGAVKHQFETCAPAITFTGPGVYKLNLGKPSSWWKKNGIWDFTKAPDKVRVMLKDVSTGKLLLSRSCGVSCYTGNDLAAHTPITFKATVVLVRQGAPFAPPPGW